MKKKSAKPLNPCEGNIAVKVDKPTLEAFVRVIKSGLKQDFEDILFKNLYLTSLRSLIVKLAAALLRIRKSITFRFTAAEAFCYRLTVEFWHEENPAALECIVSQKYFPLP